MTLDFLTFQITYKTSLAIPGFVQSRCYLFCGYLDRREDWISVGAMAFGLKINTIYLRTFLTV